MPKRQAVFLDRDGTLNELVIRPGTPDRMTAPFFEHELVFDADAVEAMERLRHKGFLRIIVTNQPDVAHGNTTEQEWKKISDKVEKILKPDAVYACRHLAMQQCFCRKPLPGMLTAAALRFDIDLARSFMVGDMETDMTAGRLAGCRTVLIDRPYNKTAVSELRAANILEAVHIIVGDST